MKSLLAFWCLVSCCAFFPIGDLLAQCTVPTGVPASGACPTTGTLVTAALDGTTLAAATTYYYTSATPLTLTNVTIKGTLYVCGNLTINTLNFSGTPNIIVEPGGSLTIYTGTLKGDITNYGTLAILDGSSQVTIDAQVANYGTLTFGDTGANIGTGINGNSGYLLYNGVGAKFTVEGTSINSAAITNMGQMYFDADLNQQNASICEGNDAEITVEDFNDDTSPGIALDAPGDVAGLIVTKILGGSSSNGTLANSANVLICEAPGITIGSPYLPGSATVEANCTTLGVLAVTLESFTASAGLAAAGINNTCTLNWRTASEDGLLDFVLESSTDAKVFSPVATIPAHGAPSGYTYSTGLRAGTTWFRLQLNNRGGGIEAYSAVLPVEVSNGISPNMLRVEPSLVTTHSLQVQTTLSTAQSGVWVVMDMMGRVILRQQAALDRGATTTVLSLPYVASGVYELALMGGTVSIAPARFAVIH
jgi:hypothetical protein